MILTPVSLDTLPDILNQFQHWLKSDARASQTLNRIAATQDYIPLGVDKPEHRVAAIALAHQFGIPTLDEEPAQAFSWDGQTLRTRSEAWVILHEIAHWQLSPPHRRHIVDFGLGAGPETGRKAHADSCACTSADERQEDEAMASLLGILWEVELNQPAILAFLEQNWLEGYDRPSAARHFSRILSQLHSLGFVDDAGRPCARPCPLKSKEHMLEKHFISGR